MLRTLFKREIREVYKRKKFVWLIVGIIVGSLIPFYSTSKSLYFQFLPEFYNVIYLFILYTVNFIFISLPYLVEHFYRDRIRGNIEVLLCLSFSPLKIWLIKLLTVFLMNYPLYVFGGLISLIINFLLKTLSISKIQIIIFLFISPIFAFSILGLNAFLHFFFQDIRLLNLFFILPFVIFIVIFNYSTKFLVIFNLNIYIFSISMILISFLIIFSILLLFKILSKENFINKSS
ncbi:MAG: hypothetical protein ABIN23_02185 [candidate division WOR-3 bacterium]